MKLILLTLATIALFQGALAEEPYPWNCHGDEYIAQSAAVKQERMWENVLYDLTSADWTTPGEVAAGIIAERMCLSFTTGGDELPHQGITNGLRRKLIHPVGVMSQVEWVAMGGHPYTGIFESGAKHAMARLSLALEPDAVSTAPGMGLKILRDGMDSVNLVAMYSVDGQESWNWFANNFTNHIPEISGPLVILAAKFSSATNNINQVGIMNWSYFTAEGKPVDNPVFPFMLRFQPTGEFNFPDTYTRPFPLDLLTLPADSVLYEIYAQDLPTEMGGTDVKIGELVLRTEPTTSRWGDDLFFIRHDDEAHDLVEHPEWNKYVPQFGMTFHDDPHDSSHCTYAKMFKK